MGRTGPKPNHRENKEDQTIAPGNPFPTSTLRSNTGTAPTWTADAWDKEGEDELSSIASSPAGTATDSEGDGDDPDPVPELAVPHEPTASDTHALTQRSHDTPAKPISGSTRGSTPGQGKKTTTTRATRRARKAQVGQLSGSTPEDKPGSIISSLPFPLVHHRATDRPDPKAPCPAEPAYHLEATSDRSSNRLPSESSKSPSSGIDSTTSAERPSTPLTYPGPLDPLVIAMARAPVRRRGRAVVHVPAPSTSDTQPGPHSELTRADLMRYRSGQGPKSVPQLEREAEGKVVDWGGMSVADAAWRKYAEQGGCTPLTASGEELQDSQGSYLKLDMHVPELLRLVIAASPRQAIKVDEIYQAFENRWAVYRTHKNPDSWRNTVRHTLSMNPAFECIKSDTEHSELGKGYWRSKSESDNGRVADQTIRHKRRMSDDDGGGSTSTRPRSSTTGTNATTATLLSRGPQQATAIGVPPADPTAARIDVSLRSQTYAGAKVQADGGTANKRARMRSSTASTLAYPWAAPRSAPGGRKGTHADLGGSPPMYKPYYPSRAPALPNGESAEIARVAWSRTPAPSAIGDCHRSAGQVVTLPTAPRVSPIRDNQPPVTSAYSSYYSRRPVQGRSHSPARLFTASPHQGRQESLADSSARLQMCPARNDSDGQFVPVSSATYGSAKPVVASGPPARSCQQDPAPQLGPCGVDPTSTSLPLLHPIPRLAATRPHSVPVARSFGVHRADMHHGGAVDPTTREAYQQSTSRGSKGPDGDRVANASEGEERHLVNAERKFKIDAGETTEAVSVESQSRTTATLRARSPNPRLAPPRYPAAISRDIAVSAVQGLPATQRPRGDLLGFVHQHTALQTRGIPVEPMQRVYHAHAKHQQQGRPPLQATRPGDMPAPQSAWPGRTPKPVPMQVQHHDTRDPSAGLGRVPPLRAYPQPGHGHGPVPGGAPTQHTHSGVPDPPARSQLHQDTHAPLPLPLTLRRTAAIVPAATGVRGATRIQEAPTPSALTQTIRGRLTMPASRARGAGAGAGPLALAPDMHGPADRTFPDAVIGPDSPSETGGGRGGAGAGIGIGIGIGVGAGPGARVGGAGDSQWTAGAQRAWTLPGIHALLALHPRGGQYTGSETVGYTHAAESRGQGYAAEGRERRS